MSQESDDAGCCKGIDDIAGDGYPSYEKPGNALPDQGSFRLVDTNTNRSVWQGAIEYTTTPAAAH